MMLLKCCTQYVSKFGKLGSDHDRKISVFIPIKKKDNTCQRMLKLQHNCAHFTCKQNNAQNLSSQASTVHELRTSRFSSWIQERKKNQRSNCQHPLDHRESKGIPEDYFCFIDYLKFFDCMDHIILWKILKEIRIQDSITCLWRNLYTGQEATVGNGH